MSVSLGDCLAACTAVHTILVEVPGTNKQNAKLLDTQVQEVEKVLQELRWCNWTQCPGYKEYLGRLCEVLQEAGILARTMLQKSKLGAIIQGHWLRGELENTQKKLAQQLNVMAMWMMQQTSVDVQAVGHMCSAAGDDIAAIRYQVLPQEMERTRTVVMDAIAAGNDHVIERVKAGISEALLRVGLCPDDAAAELDHMRADVAVLTEQLACAEDVMKAKMAGYNELYDQLIGALMVFQDATPTTACATAPTTPSESGCGLAESIICSICREVLHNPVQVPTRDDSIAHTYCRACITTWMKTSDKDPNSGVRLTGQVLPNLQLRNVIEYMQAGARLGSTSTHKAGVVTQKPQDSNDVETQQPQPQPPPQPHQAIEMWQLPSSAPNSTTSDSNKPSRPSVTKATDVPLITCDDLLPAFHVEVPSGLSRSYCCLECGYQGPIDESQITEDSGGTFVFWVVSSVLCCLPTLGYLSVGYSWDDILSGQPFTLPMCPRCGVKFRLKKLT